MIRLNLINARPLDELLGIDRPGELQRGLAHRLGLISQRRREIRRQGERLAADRHPRMRDRVERHEADRAGPPPRRIAFRQHDRGERRHEVPAVEPVLTHAKRALGKVSDRQQGHAQSLDVVPRESLDRIIGRHVKAVEQGNIDLRVTGFQEDPSLGQSLANRVRIMVDRAACPPQALRDGAVVKRDRLGTEDRVRHHQRRVNGRFPIPFDRFARGERGPSLPNAIRDLAERKPALRARPRRGLGFERAEDLARVGHEI